MPKITHGHTVGSHSREYQAWANMLKRCTCAAYPQYAKYGGRGITVCERWGEFQNFLDDMGLCPDGHSLDRIDNDSGYWPTNCRWADRKTQQRNTSRNRYLTARGETHSLAEWAEITGINRKTLLKRLQLGWSPERAIVKNGDIHVKA